MEPGGKECRALTIATLCTLLVFLLPAAVETAPAPSRRDVLVYGGIAAAIAASRDAVQAARMGKHVVLAEPVEYLGG